MFSGAVRAKITGDYKTFMQKSHDWLKKDFEDTHSIFVRARTDGNEFDCEDKLRPFLLAVPTQSALDNIALQSEVRSAGHYPHDDIIMHNKILVGASIPVTRYEHRRREISFSGSCKDAKCDEWARTGSECRHGHREGHGCKFMKKCSPAVTGHQPDQMYKRTFQ